MTPKEIQTALRDRLLRNADYIDGLIVHYQTALDQRPRHADKQKIAKMRTLAILSREIAYELTR
jgi:hypothetical protein